MVGIIKTRPVSKKRTTKQFKRRSRSRKVKRKSRRLKSKSRRLKSKSRRLKSKVKRRFGSSKFTPARFQVAHLTPYDDFNMYIFPGLGGIKGELGPGNGKLY